MTENREISNEPSESERMYASLIYISLFFVNMVPILGFLIPYFLWQNKKQSNFINHHGKEAVNLTLTALAFGLFLGLCFLIAFLITGANIEQMKETLSQNAIGFASAMIIFVGLMFILGIYFLVTILIGLFKAYQGDLYSHKIRIKFFK
jgi:uncharacterized Tic20 family protein